jgi:EmrB/QacA subfamily drug resistance transporter
VRSSAAGSAASPHHRFAFAALATAGTAVALMQTMVAPALPVLQREYHTSPAGVTWVLTIYLLVASVATPLLGRLGDMFGKDRMLMIVLTATGAGTVLCAVAGSLELVVLGRAVQGSSAVVFPLAFGILRDELPRHRLNWSIGLISATYGIGSAGGVVLGGLVVDRAGTSWMFWSMLPLIVISAVMVHVVVPRSPARVRCPIDWTGGLLLSVGLAAILLAISDSGTWGWLSAPTVVLLAGGMVVLVVFAWYEQKASEPLLDMRVMRSRAVWTTNLTAVISGFGMFASLLLIPQLVQIPSSAGFGFGASVLQAGLFLLPSAAAMLVCAPIAGLAAARYGGRAPLLAGIVLVGLSFAELALLHSESWEILLSSLLAGAGLGLSTASMASVIVDAVPASQTAVATGMNAIMRSTGGALNSQVTASILGAHTVVVGGLPREHAFVLASVVACVALAVGALAALLIPDVPASQVRRVPATLVQTGQASGTSI